MKRSTVIVAAMVVAAAVVLVGAAFSGWWMFRNSPPRTPAACTGRVSNLERNSHGELEFHIIEYDEGKGITITVPTGVPVRRRDGGAGELRDGQTVSVWVHSMGALLDETQMHS